MSEATTTPPAPDMDTGPIDAGSKDGQKVPSPAEIAAGKEMRAASPYTFWEKIKRVIWDYFGQLIFKISFHDWYGFRNMLLRVFGAKIAKNVRIRPSVRVEQPWNLRIHENASVGDNVILYCLGEITIGPSVSISQYAHLCAGTHDHRRPDMPLVKLPITLEEDVWLAADVFIGPGVTVGKEAVVGARSSVYKDIEGGWVYAGNPARQMKRREYVK